MRCQSECKYSHCPIDDEVIKLISFSNHILWILLGYVLHGTTHVAGMQTGLAQADLVSRQNAEGVVPIWR